MIFLSAATTKAVTMIIVFNQLASTLGQHNNQLKSKVNFNREVTTKDQILSTSRMVEDILLVKYLGVPLSADYIHHIAYHCQIRILSNLRGGTVVCYQL